MAGIILGRWRGALPILAPDPRSRVMTFGAGRRF
jgi:hypothetical protein